MPCIRTSGLSCPLLGSGTVPACRSEPPPPPLLLLLPQRWRCRGEVQSLPPHFFIVSGLASLEKPSGSKKPSGAQSPIRPPTLACTAMLHEAGATVRMAPLGTKDATLRARREPGLSGAARAAGRGAVGRRSRRGSARREDRKHYGPEIAIILEGITSVDTRLRKTLFRAGASMAE